MEELVFTKGRPGFFSATERNAREQQDSRTAASRHGQEWSNYEYDVIARDDLTHVEAAALLGRTVKAVRTKRYAR